MKAKDIIYYEKGNKNTILLVVNKTVCRAFDVSAFLLSQHVPIRRFYNKYSRSMNTHMVYAWFSVRRLDRVLDELQAQGFHPSSRKKNYIILKKDSLILEGYDEWREKVYNEAMVEAYTLESIE